MSQDSVRVVPHDLLEGSFLAQAGKFVDIASLLPQTDSLFLQEYKDRIQSRYDWMSETRNSEEFKLFCTKTVELLGTIHGQFFLFDLQGTLLHDIFQLEHESWQAFYTDLYMQEIVLALLARNHVGFFTSASTDVVAKMKQCLHQDLRELQTISRDDWKIVIDAYVSLYREEIRDHEAFERIITVCNFARPESCQVGIQLFNAYKIAQYERDPETFLRQVKYPQVFLSPTNGFFIDDSEEFVEQAMMLGLPFERVIHCAYDGREQGANTVIDALLRAIQ